MLRLKVANQLRTSTPRGQRGLEDGRGGARSRRTGTNAVADYSFFEQFGAHVAKNGQELKTGGPGNVQAPNPAISPGLTRQYNRFLFRLANLFRNTPAFVASPRGFGSLAELYGYSPYRAHGQLAEPMAFGAHDAFWDRLTTAFAPMLGEAEVREYRAGSAHSPAALAEKVKGATLKAPAPSAELRDRMPSVLAQGFARIDQQREAGRVHRWRRRALAAGHADGRGARPSLRRFGNPAAAGRLDGGGRGRQARRSRQPRASGAHRHLCL